MATITTALGDITTFDVDAIVNAANSSLLGGGGVDGAIHAAGGPTILEECSAIVAATGPLATGNAVITGAGDLPASFVIHTVGPVFSHHDPDEAADLLASCYRSSLDRAAENECASIAFPNISTGVYGYPKPAAARIAYNAVIDWVRVRRDSVEAITFVCFDRENYDQYNELRGAS